MPHLTELNGAPLEWATLYERHAAYYAARAERERACAECGHGKHALCSGWMAATPGNSNWRDRISCECECRERAQRDALTVRRSA